MFNDLELASQRFAVFAQEVLAPAAFPLRAPLDVAVHQCPDPISIEAARGAEYTPVDVGWRWGPVWSSAWFRIAGVVPAAMAGQTVVLRFSSGTEALLRDDADVPRQGFDVNRDMHRLFAPAHGGEPVDLLIEAACNHALGITGFWWETPEARARWTEPRPGRLERCELAVFDATAWRLWETYEFARQLLVELSDDAARGHVLSEAIAQATRLVDERDVAARADAALAVLEAGLAAPASSCASRCIAVGHAHIDTAWLWPIRETRRKCQRSFANVLELMERFPDFRFLCSQAQQYAWVEADAPGLFRRIAERVADGRWEPMGAMWIEPDCNVPSGESLVRQILHGERYWRDRFGARGRQRLLYLPDTFGFPAALPQIMAAAGLDTFITNKLSWNQTNPFPLMSFRWRGIDGTEVVAHCTPGHDYNATNTPAELRRGEANCARKDRGRTGVWLQPFGYGDGGGGPTAAMIRRAELAGDAEGLPRTTLGGAGAFCDALHAARDALRARGDDLPVWDGELYLELHRGTLTSQAWIKRANRRAEIELRAAEWLASAGPTSAPADDAAVRAALDEAWKLVLLNQFHDILPGSSIAPVYDDARAQFARVDELTRAVSGAAAARWAAAARTRDLRDPMIVYNASSAPRSGVVECAGALHHVRDVPALGVAVVDRTTPAAPTPVTVDGFTLRNGIIEASIDGAGRIAELRHLAMDRSAGAMQADGARAPLNQLVVYEDRPRSWDAWELDAEYVEKPEFADGPADRRVIEREPLRAAIEVTRPIGAASVITQRYVLAAGSPRLDVETRVDWREDRRILRALFPLDIRARRATYEIQYGHIERPTHANNSWERVMFEVCAHRWADLSEPGFGVAILNDAKYGHSCRDHVLGLSLLRSPAFPDPGADRGEHAFTYALMPHDGDWRGAGVDREAHALNDPLRAEPLPPDRDGVVEGARAPFAISGPGARGVVVPAIKRAEDTDDDRLIVRLVETHGRRGEIAIDWRLDVDAVEPVDLLERRDPAAAADLRHDATARRTTLTIGPFRIVTLAAGTR